MADPIKPQVTPEVIPTGDAKVLDKPEGGIKLAVEPIDSNLVTRGSGDQVVAPLPIRPIDTAPKDSTELKEYLNEFQSQLNVEEGYDAFADAETPEIGDGAVDAFAKDKLGVTLERPTAPKYGELFEQLRIDYGLGNIETGITEYKDLIRNEEALLRQQKGFERGKTTSMSVIEGRIDQATRDRMEAISFYSDQVSFLSDQAQNAYTIIDMTMQFEQLDYNTARESYQDDFNNRMGLYDAMVEEERDVRDFEYQVEQDKKQWANTHLSMFADLIAKGNLTYGNMTADTKASIAKMEAESGLGVGFLQTIKIPKAEQIKQIFQRTDPTTGISYAEIMYVDENGKTWIESKALGKGALSFAEEVALKKAGRSTGGTTYNYGSKSADALAGDFNKALVGVNETVVATRAERERAIALGEKYVTRETLITRLNNQFSSNSGWDTSRYPVLQQIKYSVYSHYSDGQPVDIDKLK